MIYAEGVTILTPKAFIDGVRHIPLNAPNLAAGITSVERNQERV